MNWNRLLSIILRQYNFGPWLGGLKGIFNNSTFYLSLINFVLIAVTAYHTTLSGKINEYAPWFSFPLFLAMMVVLVLVVMLLEYKFMIPSSITFGNAQMYAHRNPIRRDLERIMRKLDEMDKRITELQEVKGTASPPQRK